VVLQFTDPNNPMKFLVVQGVKVKTQAVSEPNNLLDDPCLTDFQGVVVVAVKIDEERRLDPFAILDLSHPEGSAQGNVTVVSPKYKSRAIRDLREIRELKSRTSKPKKSLVILDGEVAEIVGRV
jgi:hypothetical protein